MLLQDAFESFLFERERMKRNRTEYFKNYHNNNRLRKTWHNMLSRCENVNDKGYNNYGGRGIKVCQLWHNFDNFSKWAMLNGFSSELDLDRKNNNSGYKPSNCRFITRAENIWNSRVAKVNIEDVNKIRELYLQGFAIKEIKRLFTQILPESISNIVHGRTWAKLQIAS